MEFELTDGSCSISDVQDYYEYFKIHNENNW